MALTHFWFTHALEFAFTRAKAIDWDTNDIYCMLTTNTYVPDQDTHEDKADVTNEIAGTGYTAGGDILGTETVATDTTPRMILDAADAAWTTATFTMRNAVTYENSGATDADKAIVTVVKSDQDESVTSGTFTIQWAAGGIAQVDPANLT
jgi:hypothetical protein